jgi:hypothetical protein
MLVLLLPLLLLDAVTVKDVDACTVKKVEKLVVVVFQLVVVVFQPVVVVFQPVVVAAIESTQVFTI